MRKEISNKHNSTILGFHNKSNDRYNVLRDELPILIDEEFAPFLLTRQYNFSITTKDLTNLVNNVKSYEKFRVLKNRIAQFLLLPGIAISIITLLTTSGLTDNNFLEQLASPKIVSLMFWIALGGVVILWHDYFRDRSHPVELPKIEKIEPQTVAGINTQGIEFEKYKQTHAIYYVSDELRLLLKNFVNSQGMDTFELFKELVKEERVQNLIDKANLNLNISNLGEHGIDSASMPHYPVSAVRSMVLYALNEAILSGATSVKPIHLFLAYANTFPVLMELNKTQKGSHEMLRSTALYLENHSRKGRSSNILDIHYPYYRTDGIAKGWVYGYTFNLNKFSSDITEKIQFERDRFGIGHDREIAELIAVVGKLSKNNALLIGEPGVGKSSIIKGVAQQINRGTVPQQLHGKRIIQLDVNSLIAQSGSDKKVEQMLEKAMKELDKAGNTILYIDEFQEIIPVKSEGTGHSIAGILLPYLMDSKFPIVGTINLRDYKRLFYESDSLRLSFEPIEVSEVTPADTLNILMTKVDILEQQFGLKLTVPALAAAVELSQRYVTERKLPDSAVNTLETACSWAQNRSITRLTTEEIANSISLQTNIPISEVTAQEASQLMNLEENIKNRVIGQSEAIKSVVEAIKRARTDIHDETKPIGVYLFMGPIGTGKTHLAKVLADEYFEGENRMIRLDMSEYQEVESIKRIIGDNNVESSRQTNLLDKVRAQPFSVVLFDEIEKAHPQVLDLFLQLFDEGQLTSSSGDLVNFRNCIMICTSNIGSKQLLDALNRDNSMWEEAKQTALMELRGALRTELLNRFDRVVMFEPHGIENLIKITKLLLNQLATKLSEKGITLQWDKSIPMIIANNAQEPGMGARPIKRYLQDKIETKIAEKLMTGEVESGGSVKVAEGWLV